MLFLLVTIHLAIAVGLFNVAIATTDPSVLNRPMAAAAAVVWPLSLPIVVVFALTTKSESRSGTAQEEDYVRIGN